MEHKTYTCDWKDCGVDTTDDDILGGARLSWYPDKMLLVFHLCRPHIKELKELLGVETSNGGG